jgi:hypothetical protein
MSPLFAQIFALFAQRATLNNEHSGQTAASTHVQQVCEVIHRLLHAGNAF